VNLIEALLSMIGLGQAAGPALERVEIARNLGQEAPSVAELEAYPLATWEEQAALDGWPGPLETLADAGLEEHLLDWLEQAEGWGIL
jgi:hypothetical protein